MLWVLIHLVLKCFSVFNSFSTSLMLWKKLTFRIYIKHAHGTHLSFYLKPHYGSAHCWFIFKIWIFCTTCFFCIHFDFFPKNLLHENMIYLDDWVFWHPLNFAFKVVPHSPCPILRPAISHPYLARVCQGLTPSRWWRWGGRAGGVHIQLFLSCFTI